MQHLHKFRWHGCYAKAIYCANSGTRKVERLKENAFSADILLTDDEVKALDKALNSIKMSDVFGGTKVITKS